MATKRKIITSTGTFDIGPSIFIELVYWLRPVTVADRFSITDILTGICETANRSQWFDISFGPVNSITVDTLDSGALHIYYK